MKIQLVRISYQLFVYSIGNIVRRTYFHVAYINLVIDLFYKTILNNRVLVVSADFEVGNLISDKGFEGVDHFVHFFTWFCAVFDHNGIESANIHETRNPIFAICYGIKLTRFDAVDFYDFIADLFEGEAVVDLCILQRLEYAVLSKGIDNRTSLVIRFTCRVLDERAYVEKIILLFTER